MFFFCIRCLLSIRNQAEQQAHWPMTKAQIVSWLDEDVLEVTRRRFGGTTKEKKTIERKIYQYSVNGNSYTGSTSDSRAASGDWVLGARRKHIAPYGEYPPINVYYDPAQPSQSVLMKTKFDISSTWGAVLLSCVSFVLVFRRLFLLFNSYASTLREKQSILLTQLISDFNKATHEIIPLLPKCYPRSIAPSTLYFCCSAAFLCFAIMCSSRFLPHKVDSYIRNSLSNSNLIQTYQDVMSGICAAHLTNNLNTLTGVSEYLYDLLCQKYALSETDAQTFLKFITQSVRQSLPDGFTLDFDRRLSFQI